MQIPKNKRNYGNGKVLNSYVCWRLAEITQNYAHKGTAAKKKAHSAIRKYASFLKEEFGIRYLEKVKRIHQERFGVYLYEKVNDDEIGRSTVADYISSINQMWLATGNHEMVISARQFGVSKGRRFSNSDHSISRENIEKMKNALEEMYRKTGNVHYECLRYQIIVQQETAARFQESACMKIAEKDFSENHVQLDKEDNTKNNQDRSFYSIYVLHGTREAQAFQSANQDILYRGSLIPGNMRYQEWQVFSYNVIRDLRKKLDIDFRFHGVRHSYAHESYAKKWQEKTGVKIECPVAEQIFGRNHIQSIADRAGLNIEKAREIDKEIRLMVSEELGHHRSDSTFFYLGK
ncbi:MAG: hypothetical protein Q7J27_07160 [Syntrophales bacterium]|nr:hypothetical protein [Syntrophales bacterium]